MDTTRETIPPLVLMDPTPPTTQSILRRNHELQTTLHHAESLVSNVSSLIHPPWIEEHRKQRQIQMEKEKQQELNTSRQWTSKSTRNQLDDDDDPNKPITEELIHTKLQLRLLMGQSVGKALSNLPLPGSKLKNTVTLNTSQTSLNNTNGQQQQSTRKGILSRGQDIAAQRHVRRNSLISGQGISEAFQAKRKDSTDSDKFHRTLVNNTNNSNNNDTNIVSPRHERRHHKNGLQKPVIKTEASINRRNSQGYIKGALDAAAEGNIGFTGVHLDQAPLHTKHLEELRRQVIEASKAVASLREEVLTTIHNYMQPNWRPEGRIKYLASLSMVNLPPTSTSSSPNNNQNNNNGENI